MCQCGHRASATINIYYILILKMVRLCVLGFVVSVAIVVLALALSRLSLSAHSFLAMRDLISMRRMRPRSTTLELYNCHF